MAGRSAGRFASLTAALFALGALTNPPAQAADTFALGKVQGETETVQSRFFERDIVVPPGVFDPVEAEHLVLPFIEANERLFKGKRVMEIGAGSGINGIFIAKLGAEKVVATDISDIALAAVDDNARRHGVEAIIEARLVPPSDMTATRCETAYPFCARPRRPRPSSTPMRPAGPGKRTSTPRVSASTTRSTGARSAGRGCTEDTFREATEEGRRSIPVERPEAGLLGLDRGRATLRSPRP